METKFTIDIERLYRSYSSFYNKLYDETYGKKTIGIISSATDLYWFWRWEDPCFLETAQALMDFMGDMLISDRECAAFVLAYLNIVSTPSQSYKVKTTL